MRISVVIPNYNDLRIDRALESVRNQTYKNVELVVVHGGPLTDELRTIYSHHQVDVLKHEPDEGIFDALNKGIHATTGDTIYMMGSDDYLSDENAMQDAVQLFRSNNSAVGVCLGCVFVNRDGRIIRKWFPRKVSADRIKMGILPPHFSLMLKREVYTTVGPFKYKITNNVATDIIWMIDMSIAIPNLQILTLNEHHLNMEYGGASTGSLKAIWRQYWVVHQYASQMKAELRFWWLYSLIRSGSKLFQFRR